MRLKYRIPLMIIAIMLVITVFIGSSYSLWKVTDTQTTANVIKTGCFEISFQEESASINLTNTYPMPDAKGLKTVPYIFTLTNTCDIDANYTVYLNVLSDKTREGSTPLADTYIKYSLAEEKASLAVANSLESAKLSEATNNSTDLGNFTYENNKSITTSYALKTGSLKGRTGDSPTGDSVTYNLRLWIDDTATKDIAGQTFEAAISTVATTKPNTPAS